MRKIELLTIRLKHVLVSRLGNQVVVVATAAGV